MQFLRILLTVVILLILLGILISAHEAGHLLTAKLFGVYCDEYSIGFGPKIFSHRRKNGETTFSLRAIPLGGYVSMYSAEDEDKRKKRNGEEVEETDKEGIDPDILIDHNGNPIPIERSLEHQKAWKRVIVLVAGVTVNFILSFLFCLIYAVSFPSYERFGGFLTGKSATSEPTSITYEKGKISLYHNTEEVVVLGFNVELDPSLAWGDDLHLYSAGLITNRAETIGGYLIDGEATLHSVGGDSSVSAIYYPVTENGENDLFACLSFYPNGAENTNALTKEFGFTYLPDMEEKPYTLLEGDSISLNVKTIFRNEEKELVVASHALTSTYSKTGWDFGKIKLVSEKYWAPFGQRLLNGCRQWVNFFPMMGQAINQLFHFNFESIGGIIAMGVGISQMSSYMGIGKTFFLYGGLISLNLGFVNLLPFPGLDGWSILILIIEKIARRKIPVKVKRIVQYVGLGLLFAFAAFIMVKDILQFFV